MEFKYLIALIVLIWIGLLAYLLYKAFNKKKPILHHGARNPVGCISPNNGDTYVNADTYVNSDGYVSDEDKYKWEDTWDYLDGKWIKIIEDGEFIERKEQITFNKTTKQ